MIATRVPNFEHARQQMIDFQLRSRGIRSERVLGAMGRIPREEFLPDSVRSEAYEDHPIPI
ncbi:MAG TPA: protein-L-isoaspartate O-methyltransferase, partial [bacterium]|nr:protein-L-isoaspartate O-methyltransferase [bacterium]